MRFAWESRYFFTHPFYYYCCYYYFLCIIFLSKITKTNPALLNTDIVCLITNLCLQKESEKSTKNLKMIKMVSVHVEMCIVGECARLTYNLCCRNSFIYFIFPTICVVCMQHMYNHIVSSFTAYSYCTYINKICNNIWIRNKCVNDVALDMDGIK